MIRHYFLFIYRLFVKRISSYTFNILGLTLGFFASLSALYLTTTELGYNAHFPDSRKIIRVLSFAEDWEVATASTAYNLAPTISANYPEITDFCRTHSLQVNIKLDEKEAFKDEVLFVDTSFCRMFGHEFIYGDARTALQAPNSIVLTEKYAKKLFGKVNPIGQTITISWYKYTSNLTVTGVVKEPKCKSTIDFGMLGNVSLAREYSKNWALDVGASSGDGWVDQSYETYIKLTNENGIKEILNKINNEGVKDYPGYFNLSYLMQPVRDIYLSTMEVLDDPAPHGSKLYIIILSLVGFIILFVSCINYIILSTSQAMLRTKEFGIRKVFGANNKYIITQTISEYIIFSCLAVFLAIILIEISYPVINRWFDRSTEFSLFSNPLFIPGLILVVAITVFFSTFYLNVFITRSNPISAIAGIKKRTNFRVSLHHILIGVQLIVFCVIFTSLLTINRQIRYLNNADLGLNMENIIVVSNPIISKNPDKFQFFKTKVLSDASITSVTSAFTPTLPSHLLSYFPMKAVGKENNEEVYCDMLEVNYDFIKTFGIKLKNGKDLTKNNFPVHKICCLITQSGVDAFQLAEPIGTVLSILDGEMYIKIVGVVEDFYVTSFYKKTNPIILSLEPDYPIDYYVRVSNKANIGESVQVLKNVWDEIFPDHNFNYSFYKDDYKLLYGKTNSTIKLVVVFSLFALILSLIGLYGMSNHISNLRIKEMSLRRLFGASIKENFQTMVRSFFILTLLCNLISIPISVIISNAWLRQFSFHTTFTYLNVLITFFVSLLVLLIAISGNMLGTVNKPIVEGLKERE